MKNILLVTAPKSQVQFDALESMATEAIKSKLPVERTIATAFVITGHKPLEVALKLVDIAHLYGLPIAIFELESELFRTT